MVIVQVCKSLPLLQCTLYYAHVLNLVLVDSVKSIAFASEFFSLLEALYVFVSSSKIQVLFMKKRQHQCNPHKQPLELQKLSDTHWVCRYATVNSVCQTYDSLTSTSLVDSTEQNLSTTDSSVRM